MADERQHPDSGESRRRSLNVATAGAIGTGVGAALASATGDAFWIAVGVAAGIGLGTTLNRRRDA